MNWRTLLYCGRRTGIGSDGAEYWTCWGESYIVREEGIGLNSKLVVSLVTWRNGYCEEVKYTT